MDTVELPSNLTLEECITLAITNTDESWTEIDQQLPQVCNDPSFLTWARSNTDNQESALRDLAATILQASDSHLTPDDVSKLLALMNDEGYPGFRAACALAKRLVQVEITEQMERIRAKLITFSEDPAVSKIAQEYLNSLS